MVLDWLLDEAEGWAHPAASRELKKTSSSRFWYFLAWLFIRLLYWEKTGPIFACGIQEDQQEKAGSRKKGRKPPGSLKDKVSPSKIRKGICRLFLSYQIRIWTIAWGLKVSKNFQRTLELPAVCRNLHSCNRLFSFFAGFPLFSASCLKNASIRKTDRARENTHPKGIQTQRTVRSEGDPDQERAPAENKRTKRGRTIRISCRKEYAASKKKKGPERLEVKPYGPLMILFVQNGCVGTNRNQ